MMVEKNDRNRIANFSKRALSLRSGLVYGLFALLLAVALIGGMTSAWFTIDDNTENTFTAGTLDIQVDGPHDINGQQIESDVVFDPYCAGLNYLINNRGTKTSYVRVKFEGHWERTYHKNTATATAANYSNEASDSAHFNYGPNNQQEYSSDNPNSLGFTDFEKIGPTAFAPLPSQEGSIGSGYLLSGNGYFGSHILDSGSGSSTALGEVFRVGINQPSYQFNVAQLNEIINLFGPGCLKLSGEIDSGGTFTELDGLVVKITDNGNSFNFESNYPIYHVYVKGGNDGHHIYTYYIDADKIIYDDDNDIYYVNVPSSTTIPFEDIVDSRLLVNPLNLSDAGVYQGFGLQQIGTGWSHAKFIYCVPQPQPGIELVKLVSVDGGSSWFTAKHSDPTSSYNKVLDLLINQYGYNLSYYDYSNSNDWPDLIDGITPQFQVIVANTGNVALNGVNVTDDFFANLNFNNLTLNPGQLWFSPVISYSGYLSPLSVDLVKIKLQNAFNGWNPSLWDPNPGPIKLGEYFYHVPIINSGDSTPLYIDVCLTESLLNKEYSGAVFKLYAFFEAVQTTNGLVDVNWPNNPY